MPLKKYKNWVLDPAVVAKHKKETLSPGVTVDHLAECAHDPAADVAMSHATGIAAHIAIVLSQGVDIWDAYAAVVQTSVPGLHVEKVHIALGGSFDLLADVHAPWTDTAGGHRGKETRHIGDWVNAIRKLKNADGLFYIRSTTTGVCMSPDS